MESAPYRYLIKKIDRSAWNLGRSIFFVVRIMFCAGSVPKDIFGDHPCHLNDTDDDRGQKVQYTKNNIQNIHNGLLLWVFCVKHSYRPEDHKKLNSPGLGYREEA